PAKRMPLPAVPVLDETLNALGLRGRRGEVAVLEHAAVKDRKPDLDLVHPRRVLRRVHEAKSTTMPRVELLPAVVLPVVVDVEVVPPVVDLLARIPAGERVHERAERVGTAMWHHPAEHPPRLHIEGSQKALGSVALVLVLVPDGAVAPVRVRRVPALQHLHRLLVDADNYRVLWGVEVQPA